MAVDHSPPPPAKPLRLFVAVDVPATVKDGLLASVAPFRHQIPGARWTGGEGWHVTLKFLGATWPRVVDDVRRAVVRAAGQTPPFPSALTEIGVFPSPRRARVVWAGLADPQERFGPLVQVLDDLLAEHFDPEERDYTPHLTVARLVPPRAIDEFAPGLVGTPLASQPFTIDRLVLYRSHLSPKGARYEPVLEAPLAG